MKHFLLSLLAFFAIALSVVAQSQTYVTMKVTPVNAAVSIDGEKRVLNDAGELIVRLPSGTHSYEVTAKGFAKQTKSFSLGAERVNFNVDLKSVMAALSVKSSTQGAEIFIDGKRKDMDSWSGSMLPGTYRLEVRHERYEAWQQTIVLADNDNQQIVVPALTPRLGNLDIAYMPIDAEVYLDGQLLGSSPNVFTGILIGDHLLEIRKKGYYQKSLRAKIVEGKTLLLEGNLESTMDDDLMAADYIVMDDLRGVPSSALPKIKTDPSDSSTEHSSAVSEEGPKVYNVIEQPPTFPGGEAALLKYIATHVKYPSLAMEYDIQGIVNLRFVVMEDGSVGDVQVAKSLDGGRKVAIKSFESWSAGRSSASRLDYDNYVKEREDYNSGRTNCDAEAIRVVKSLPRFIPGKLQGRAVPVWFSLPIRFQLQ